MKFPFKIVSLQFFFKMFIIKDNVGDGKRV